MGNIWRAQRFGQPHGFSPEYVPRKRFLTREELCRLLASQTRDHAAQVAFMVATSAEWGAVTRARREDVSEDLAFVHIRGTKRKTRTQPHPGRCDSTVNAASDLK